MTTPFFLPKNAILKSKSRKRTIKGGDQPPNIVKSVSEPTQKTKSIKKDETKRAFQPISVIFDSKELLTDSPGTFFNLEPFAAASKIASRYASDNTMGPGVIKIKLKDIETDKIYSYDVTRSVNPNPKAITLFKGGNGASVQFKFDHRVKSVRRSKK
jgi:hypothetical protein